MAAKAEHIILYKTQFSKQAERLALSLEIPIGLIETRSFPDGESYVRVQPGDMKQKHILLFGSLYPPNDSIIELILVCNTLRDAGVRGISLVTPYLPYMRQDKAFSEGEAVSANIMAELISHHVDHLITVDPHLHRIKKLDEVFTCRTTLLHADECLGAWVRENVMNPVIIGPDSESQQWVSRLAKQLGAPYLVFKKERRGDRNVQIDTRGIAEVRSFTPVIVDDIISTGTTMAKAGIAVFEQTGIQPVCLAIHGIFAVGAMNTLRNAGFSQIITTNSIPGKGVQIDLMPLLETSLGSIIHQENR